MPIATQFQQQSQANIPSEHTYGTEPTFLENGSRGGGEREGPTLYMPIATQFQQQSQVNIQSEHTYGTSGWPRANGETAVISSFCQRIVDKLPTPAQRVLIAVLVRAQDPNAEESYQNASAVHINAWSWFPALTLVSALGLLSIAYAFTISREGEYGLDFFLFLGLFLIFFPTLVRLVFPKTSRLERIGLLCVSGINCYLVKVMSSPLYFSFFDEFLHWRTADNILASGHLFSSNEMLPVSPYYPGLEIVTNALSTLGQLDTFQSAIIVVGVARLLMVLAIFLVNEQVLSSSRASSIATIIYMSNPHFLLFDAQYGYESLALPLAIFVLFTMAPHQTVSLRLNALQRLSPIAPLIESNRKGLSDDLRWMTITAWITIGAIAVTHHVTIFFLMSTLLLWFLIYAYMRLTPLGQSRLAKTALFSVFVAIGWTILPINPVVQYLSSFFIEALNELGHVIAGESARQLFVSYAGQPTPIWERIITIVSVLMILCCLPFGLLCLQQRYRSNALTWTFGFVALVYPLSQVFRFTNTGGELTDRAAAFLFLPISTAIAIFITQFWPTRIVGWLHTLLISFAILLLCFGGVVLGAGPSSAFFPGPYTVLADARSIEPEGIEVATWTRIYLGPNNRVATDRINQILMDTYGDQRVITSTQDKVDLAPVFLPLHLSNYALSSLRSTKTRYLVADLRLSTSLPLLGYYYESWEDDAFHRTTPADRKALTKFDAIPQINRVFDSGDIVIYDVGGLIDAPKRH
ncbi:MAG TPA: hypothetical protein VN207_06705 [Ktedonobacteraceae bacterium]|nr:hypothetical protein [Ktedonobacteraceae bacterium]